MKTTIARKRRAGRGGAADAETSFESLRAQGVRLTQALSGHTWTDYNLHDPGVTILEQLCYALTDLVYRADFPVADHLLAPGEKEIDYAGLSLHPPADAFPSRATNASDYRRALLDQVPGLDDAVLATPDSEVDSVQVASDQGIYQLRLKLSQGIAPDDKQRVAQARAAYRARRTLCEDIDSEVKLISDAHCDLQLDIEISGPRDAVDVLADVYGLCALHIAQGLHFHSFEDLVARGLSLEQIYTGPVTELGFERDGDPARAELLFVNDLTLLARGVEGVREVRALALRRDAPDNNATRSTTTSALRWRGEDWALRLRVPGVTPGLLDAQSVQALLDGEVQVRRAGSRVKVSPRDLINRMANLYVDARTRRHGQARGPTEGLPHGVYRDLQTYSSVQDGFPAVYGLGHRGMPASATLQQQAQALQLQTYLQLFEQVMANSSAQIEHLRDLFSARDAKGPSYWWQLLDDPTVPGVNAMYLPPEGEDPATWSTEAIRARVLSDVYAARDPQVDRRSRALDHLLALHGETLSQNTLRQFFNHLSPDELDATLLDNKAAFLNDIVRISRDRAGGLDYAQASWGLPEGGSGWQRRVGHLLGFRHVHSHPLTHAVHQQQCVLVAGHDDSLPDVGDTAPAPRHTQPLTHDDLHADLARMPPLRRPQLNEALLRCGAHRDRYRLAGAARDHANAAAPIGPQRLLLGPDENGRWWPLGECDNPEIASRAIESLRRFLLHINVESEGLHVVEHVLLRPVGASPAHDALSGLPTNFYSLRLTAVFPRWTTRTAQENFRRFADETVRINCPAHLAPRCLWLDFNAMQHFEVAYAQWLSAKLDFCTATASARDEANADPAAAERLNQAACAVIETLREVWPTEPEHDA